MKSKKARNIMQKISKALIYFVLICISFVFLRPIFSIISKTFMSAEDVIDPAVEWLPKSFSINNLKVAANVLKLPVTLKNSIVFSSFLLIMYHIYNLFSIKISHHMTAYSTVMLFARFLGLSISQPRSFAV